MDPITIIMMASAGLKFAQEAIPVIRDMFSSGQVPVEQQAEVLKRYNDLRALAGSAYTGPEWELSGR